MRIGIMDPRLRGDDKISNYAHIHTINKERKRTKKKERLLLTLKPKTGHF